MLLQKKKVLAYKELSNESIFSLQNCLKVFFGEKVLNLGEKVRFLYVCALMACVCRCLQKPEVVSFPKLESQVAVSHNVGPRACTQVIWKSSALVPENYLTKQMAAWAIVHRGGAHWMALTLAEREDLPVLGALSSGRPRCLHPSRGTRPLTPTPRSTSRRKGAEVKRTLCSF